MKRLLPFALLLAACAGVRTPEPRLEGAPLCLITGYGARGDGKTVSTGAIQRAIDACYARGGGTVWVPGGHFVTGTLELRSRVRLHLDAGAVLAGSTRLSDYPVHPAYFNAERARAEMGDDADLAADETGAAERARFLILARNVEDVAITGTGAIDGRGPAFAYDAETGAATPGRPLYWILIDGVQRFTMRDVRLLDPTGWGVSLRHAEDVVVDGVSLTAPERSPNTDGFDLRGVRRGRFSNLYIRTGDDAICFKAQPGEVNEDIVITNSVLQSDDAAIKFGTATHDVTRRVLISNVEIVDTRYGIAVFMRDGGVVEDVRVENVRFSGRSRHATDYPLYLDIDRRTPERAYGAIRRFTVSGLEAATRGSVLIGGQPGAPIEDLTLENVILRVAGAVSLDGVRKPLGARSITPDPASVDLAAVPAHVTLGHVRRLHVEGLRVRDAGTGASRAALHLEGVEDARMDGLDIRADAARPLALRAVRTRGLVLRGAVGQGYGLFLDGLDGLEGLAVQASDLRGAGEPWRVPPGVRVRHKGVLFAPGHDPGLADEEARRLP